MKLVHLVGFITKKKAICSPTRYFIQLL